MTTTAIVVLLVLLVGVAAIAVDRRFRKNRRGPGKTGAAETTIPLSAFSDVNHPAALQAHQEVNPLTEAEVYVAYGRREQAREVLNRGVRQGRITAQEAGDFWERHGGEPAARQS